MTKRKDINDWTPKARFRALRGVLRPSDGEDAIHLSYVAYMEEQGEDIETMDCSCCDHFLWIEPAPDYGICVNPASPRRGLLTWEHMGCPKWMGG